MPDVGAHLDVARPPIQIHVQVLDLAVVAKHLLEVLLAGFLVDVGHEDDPAFDGSDCYRTGRCAYLGGGAAVVVGWGLIDIHLCVRHCADFGDCVGSLEVGDLEVVGVEEKTDEDGDV